MLVKLPEPALKVLNNPDKFMKRDAEIVARLVNCRDAGFIKAFHGIGKNIEQSLYSEGFVWDIFLLLLVEYSFAYQKEKKPEITEAKKEFSKKLEEIVKTSNLLSKQIQVTSLLAAKYGFYGKFDVNSISLLQNAAKNQVSSEKKYLFDDRIADNLELVRANFELKYFPEVTDIIDEIGRQYSNGFECSGEAMTPDRVGKINFFWVHFKKAIDHNIKTGLLPSNILLVSNPMLVDILRISLDDESITEQNIKDTIGTKK